MNGVKDRPCRGLRRLLHEPSIVRKGALLSQFWMASSESSGNGHVSKSTRTSLNAMSGLAVTGFRESISGAFRMTSSMSATRLSLNLNRTMKEAITIGWLFEENRQESVDSDSDVWLRYIGQSCYKYFNRAHKEPF